MPSGSNRRGIGVISRAPLTGTVKSRLARSIGEQAAAILYRAFLRDVLVNAASMARTEVNVFHPSAEAADSILSLIPPGVIVQEEQGHGYSQIIPAALRTMLDRSPVACLIGADSPGLPAAIVEQAFEAIESGVADIAIGPASDGGYCVLAVRGDHPGLFDDVAWGTDEVFAQVAERAGSLDLRIHTLPEWYDIDDLQGLTRLIADLAGNVEIAASASRSAIRYLRTVGHPLPESPAAWHIEQQEIIYETPWRILVSDRVTTHRNERIDYTYLRAHSAVWVVPVTTAGRIVLIRQYRHPVGEFVNEVPAGGGSETPAEIARRELGEETGGVPGRLIHVADYFPASAHITHQGHVFVALDVEFGAQELESTELLSVFTVPFDLALDMARRGEIGDAQSALAILAAEPIIRVALGADRIENTSE